MWEKLVVLLTETLKAYQALLEMSRKKHELLVKVKPQELDKITQQEEVIILHAGKVDAAREAVVKELAGLYGIAGDAITFVALKEHADESTRKELAELAEELEKVLEQLAPLNKLNVELIQQSLQYIDFNINILAQNSTSPTYAPKGQNNQPTQKRVIFDAKV